MNRYETIKEVEKADRYDHLEEIEKFNPYHDSRGRFSSANGYASFTIQTKDPKKQHLADMAVARMGGKPMGGAKKPVTPQKPVDTSKPPAGTKTQTDHPPGKNLKGDDGVNFVAKQTGADLETAEKMFDATKDFTDGMYKQIRTAGFKGSPPASQSAKKQADLVDKMIEEAPKYDGEVFRGIGTDMTTAKQIIKQAQDGHLISQMGAASFSTNEKVAMNFGMGESEGAVIIFVSKGVQNGTSVRPISKYYLEEEVLMSSQARWKPTGKVTEEPGGGYSKVYKVEMEPFWGDPAEYEASLDAPLF